jgi:DNA-binding beta-propeller fold protein YncE
MIGIARNILRLRTAGRQVIASRAVKSARPGTVAFLPDGGLAHVPLETSSAIANIDAHTLQLIESLKVAGPALPTGSAVSPSQAP